MIAASPRPCQPQPAGAVTLTVPPSPPLPTSACVGERLYVQGAAAWLTVKDWPATAIDPLRGVPAALAATE